MLTNHPIEFQGREFQILLGYNYLSETNCSNIDAQNFENNVENIIILLEDIIDNNLNNKNEISRFKKLISEYKEESFNLTSKFKEGACLNNNIAVFNAILHLKIASYKEFLEEFEIDLISFFSLAKFYISKAIKIVEEKLVNVYYEEISEAIIKNINLIEDIEAYIEFE